LPSEDARQEIGNGPTPLARAGQGQGDEPGGRFTDEKYRSAEREQAGPSGRHREVSRKNHITPMPSGAIVTAAIARG
jgi:hypothetical protein